MLYRPMERSPVLRRGATAVEFALVAPVFFMFILGLIELGRGMMVQSLLENAARAGVRTGQSYHLGPVAHVPAWYHFGPVHHAARMIFAEGIVRLYRRSSVTPQRNKGSGQRPATAAVEMALVVPLLMLISFGMFELSRGWVAKNIVNDAARKGCRTGIMANKANSDVTADINNILTDNGFDPTKATITILLNGTSSDVKNAQRGDSISVQVS